MEEAFIALQEAIRKGKPKELHVVLADEVKVIKVARSRFSAAEAVRTVRAMGEVDRVLLIDKDGSVIDACMIAAVEERAAPSHELQEIRTVPGGHAAVIEGVHPETYARALADAYDRGMVHGIAACKAAMEANTRMLDQANRVMEIQTKGFVDALRRDREVSRREVEHVAAVAEAAGQSQQVDLASLVAELAKSGQLPGLLAMVQSFLPGGGAAPVA